MGNSIRVTINGFQEHVPERSTILDLIAAHEEGDIHLIVEHNGRCFYPDDYGKVVVKEGDRMEFINPSFGG